MSLDPEWRRGARLALSLSLAHHPLCSWFGSDTVRAGPARLCAGCTFAIPGFIVGLAAAAVAIQGAHAPPLPLVGAGLILGLPQLSTYAYRGGLTYRALAKALGGLGLGLAMAGTIAFPLPVAVKAGAATVLGAAFIVLQFLRMRSIVATCRACPWAMDWDRCPGFNVAPPTAPFKPRIG